MRRLFNLLSITIYTAAVFLAGMVIGQLYALYVLVYTGAVFMIGVFIGDRLERKLASNTVGGSPSGSEPKVAEAPESSELTLKE